MSAMIYTSLSRHLELFFEAILTILPLHLFSLSFTTYILPSLNITGPNPLCALNIRRSCKSNTMHSNTEFLGIRLR
jgi:hypothetical protein